MYLFHFFRSFLPLHNTIGFGAVDFVELAFPACLLILLLSAPALSRISASVINRPLFVMAALAAVPVLLRLALLHQSPVPTPSGSDDFSYLLLADTLAQFRLSNPTHPLYRFFEANFVLQQPTYSSIFPLGQGIALAFGHLLFGSFWAGVLLSSGVLCALCYWMLRGWTTERWARIGGLLAIVQFGPLCQWTNCYWGGAVSACAGCLVFGALPRLRMSWKRRDAILLGLGLGLQLLARPFEFILLLVCAGGFFTPQLRALESWRRFAKAGLVTFAALFPAVVLLMFHNKAVTGNWTTMPYQISRVEYGVPATFTFQPNAKPHRELTAEQLLDYSAQAAIHGEHTDTAGSFLERLAYRLRYYRFFFLPPLYLALPFFFFHSRRKLVLFAAASVAIFALGTDIYPYFYPHYVAALTSVLLLVSVLGLDVLSKIRFRSSNAGSLVGALLVLLCGAHFLFWYSLHLFGSSKIAGVFDYETTNYINWGDTEGRNLVNSELARAPGQQLVFVRYSPEHGFHEWIHNSASIDSERVVWAGDRGAEDNQHLIGYFPRRRVWLLEPDADPPRLTSYPQQSGIFEDIR